MVAAACVAAVLSYRHAYEHVTTHGETGLTARPLPSTTDRLILAAPCSFSTPGLRYVDRVRHSHPPEASKRRLPSLHRFSAVNMSLADATTAGGER